MHGEERRGEEGASEGRERRERLNHKISASCSCHAVRSLYPPGPSV